MSIAIQVDNLSKAYQIGQFGTGTISRDLERWWASFRGKEDPFLKIGEKNDRLIKGNTDIVWSLRDINFNVEQGDVIGLIGRNGAGKSTLLKILSQVTSPTQGNIKIKGRIASLLEVGTGFHPELTGRENIFLNGAILGMKKAEIVKKFDEIVDFSGVERYIDTPVKRYSSGMYVRLAFAVAANLESEILVIDEVLAVGDLEFQKKCLGKIGDISNKQGRTVLFVSHNLGSIKHLCPKSILLENGEIRFFGNTDLAIDKYINATTTVELDKIKITEGDFRRGSGISRFVKIIGFENRYDFYDDIRLSFQIDRMLNKKDIFFRLLFRSPKTNELIFTTGLLKIESEQFDVIISKNQIMPSDYSVYVWMGDKNGDAIDLIEGLYNLRVQASPDNFYNFDPGKVDSYINLNCVLNCVI